MNDKFEDSETLYYQIQPSQPETHLFDVHCTIPKPNPAGQQVALPVWIPGSYLIRDFAQHVITLRAESNGKPIAAIMIDKTTWQCEPVTGPLTFIYQVYAFDWVPRGAHIDTTHAFFNGSRVFLQVVGQEHAPCEIEILPPLEKIYQTWRVGTSLRPKTATHLGFGRYKADNFDDLIDHPVEMGTFSVVNFEACGVPHALMVTGTHRGDLERLKTDLMRICEYHIQFFGLPAPMDRYVFLLTVFSDAYGGLEHRYSSALHCRRDQLPKIGEAGVSEGYRTLLALFSHEYFHAWNVKRIKPMSFSPYNLTQENYTRQLWIFEGITSYYDELALVRTGLISRDNYFELVGQLISNVYSKPGRFKQTLAESSFEAWTKFYRPNENSVNATISYYTKGALVALVLDLLLRQKTDQRCSLDTVMKCLWEQYGLVALGLPEEGFEALVQQISGCDLKPFFDLAVRGTEDLPLESVLNPLGILLKDFPLESMEFTGGKMPAELSLGTKPSLDIKLRSNTVEAQIASVFSGGSAEQAGLCPGDIIIAVNGFKIDRARLESTIGSYAIGEEIMLHIFRLEQLMTFKIQLQASTVRGYALVLDDQITPKQKDLLDLWIK